MRLSVLLAETVKAKQKAAPTPPKRWFMVRVELHGVDENHGDYSKLHAAMDKRGFRKDAFGRRGLKVRLPPAEYLLQKAASTKEVRDLAVGAAWEAGHYPPWRSDLRDDKSCTIVAIKISTIRVTGLRPTPHSK